MKYRVLQIGELYYPQRCRDGITWTYFERFDVFNSLEAAKKHIALIISPELEVRIHPYP